MVATLRAQVDVMVQVLAVRGLTRANTTSTAGQQPERRACGSSPDKLGAAAKGAAAVGSKTQKGADKAKRVASNVDAMRRAAGLSGVVVKDENGQMGRHVAMACGLECGVFVALHPGVKGEAAARFARQRSATELR